MKSHLLVLPLCVATACAPGVVVRDHESACRVTSQYVSRGQHGFVLNRDLSAADVVELSAPFPRAYPHAVNAYNLRIAALVVTGLGAAGLAGSFITGFVPDRTPTVDTALYATVATTIGLGVAALILGPVSVSQHNKAINELGAAVAGECEQTAAMPPSGPIPAPVAVPQPPSSVPPGANLNQGPAPDPAHIP